jgi:hypothetical protein
MSDIYGPILPLQLDPRNLTDIVRAIQTRIYLESDGKLNDFTAASPLSAISEGFGFAQAELLYYLNNLPEAFSLQWLRQLGVQRRVGSRAMAEVTFYRAVGYSRAVIIPPGTKVYTGSGLMFTTLSEVRLVGSTATGTVVSEKWGSVYNVSAEAINKIEKNFLGLESLGNTDPAVGGRDLETLDEMKQRAFEVLSRRNITTAADFENEIRTVAPEAEILKVLTYEERFKLDPQSYGKVLVVAGTATGQAISTPTIGLISDSLRNRVTLGTTVSVVSPNVIPLTCSLEIFYNPLVNTTSVDNLAAEAYQVLVDYLNPLYLGLGQDLLYQPLLREVYNMTFVDKVGVFDTKVMIRDTTILDGICLGFSGTETETECLYNYEAVVNSDNQTYTSPDPASSYRLYNAYITLTSSIDFSSLTYSYKELYQL